MECLIGKLSPMQLFVPGAIGHFYAMQATPTLARAVKGLADNLYARFHKKIKLQRNLCAEMTDRPTYPA